MRLHEDPAFRTAAEVLAALGTEWAGIGGKAANVYRAQPRETIDYDFYVRSLDGLKEALIDHEFEIIKQVTVDSTGAVLQQIRAARHGERYDFNLADHEYQFEVIARAKANNGINTVEDVIVQKLLAWRDRDRDDIASILSTGRTVDFVYVRRWCRTFDEATDLGLTERLASALQIGDQKRNERTLGR